MKVILSGRKFPDEFYAESTLLLGEWCVAKSWEQDVLLKENVTILSHPWKDPLKLAEDFKSIKNFYNLALNDLSRQLNIAHKENMSVRSWEVIIGVWLRTFINITFERSMLLTAAQTEYGIDEILIDATSLKTNRASTDTKEFLNRAQSDDWYERLSWDLLKLNGSDIKMDKVTSCRGEDMPKILVPDGFFRRVKNISLRVVAKIDTLAQKRKKFILHRLGYSFFDEVRMFVHSRLIPHFYFSEPEYINFDSNIRENFKIEPLRYDSFMSTLYSLLPQYMPKLFLENFISSIDFVDRTYPEASENIITGTGYYIDDYFKLYVARAIEKGVNYSIIQHGGGFGMAAFNDEEELKLKTADVIYSWGWTQNPELHSKTKIVPIGSITLGKLQNRLGALTNRNPRFIICPISEWTRYTFRLFSASLPFRQIDYLTDACELHHSLSHSAQKLLKFRLQSGDRGWHVKNWFELNGLGDSVLSNTNKFVDDFADAKILIVNTISTTIIEAFISNIPTIAIVREDHWGLREEVRPIFGELARVGILYTDNEHAARHIEKIVAAPEDWWGRSDVQQVRATFLEEFGVGQIDLITRIKSRLG